MTFVVWPRSVEYGIGEAPRKEAGYSGRTCACGPVYSGPASAGTARRQQVFWVSNATGCLCALERIELTRRNAKGLKIMEARRK